MVNSLVSPIKKLKNSDIPHKPKGFTTNKVKECASIFVKSMSEDERMRFKKMLDLGVNCGESVAKLYEIDQRDFIDAVKEII